MKINKVLVILFFIAYLIFVSPVFAGGQMISLEADSYGTANSDGTYSRIMRVVTQEKPCEGIEITFKFVNPQEGDYVMTQSGNETFTFTKDRQPYYQDGEQVCGTTAKMGSKVAGVRDVTVVSKHGDYTYPDPPVIKVDFDGQYHADNSYNGYNYSSSQDHPSYRLTHSQTTSNPVPVSNTGSFYAKIGVQKYLGESKRSVYISWSKSLSAVKYNVYARLADDKNYGAALVGTGDLSSEININAFLNYYVKIDACTSADSCVSSPELYIAAIKKQGGVSTSQNSTTVQTQSDTQNTNTVIKTVIVKDSSETARLQGKVDELEKKLDISQKKQSALEQTLSNLIKWIKSVFPFSK